MTNALSEPEIVQNPALGAFALWRFGAGFQTDGSHPVPLPLAFLVLPLLLHQPTLKMITTTQRASGLALFAAKLGEERENLLAVHDRTFLLRRLSLQSIAMGVDNRLLTLDYDAATIRSNITITLHRKPTVPERLRGFSSAAEKLGYWFSRLGLHQIASTLVVEF
jgi:hypothetical protein